MKIAFCLAVLTQISLQAGVASGKTMHHHIHSYYKILQTALKISNQSFPITGAKTEGATQFLCCSTAPQSLYALEDRRCLLLVHLITQPRKQNGSVAYLIENQ